MTVEGGVRDGGLLRVMRRIAASRGSGLMAVQGEHDLVSVTFEDGAIVAADGMNRPSEQILGEVLAAEGVIDPQRYAAAIGEGVADGRLAGDVLLERGLVEKSVLLDAVRRQIYRQTSDLFRWRSGEYSWAEGAESPYQDGVEPLSLAELVLRAAEDFGWGGPGEVSEGAFERSPEGAPIGVLGVDEGWREEEESKIWLTPAEDRVLEALDRRRTLPDLVLRTGLRRDEVRYAVRTLLEHLLIDRVEAPTDASAPGGPEASWAVSELRSEQGSLPPIDEALEGFDPGPPEERTPPREAETASPAPTLPSLEALAGAPLGARSPTPEPSIDPPASLSGLSDYQPWLREERPSRPWVRSDALVQVLSLWCGRVLAVGLLVLLVWQGLLAADRAQLLYPFFWQDAERSRLEEQHWLAARRKIEDSVRVYSLLYGRYPEDLEILVALDLLSDRDLRDARGHWVYYTAGPDDYTLALAEGERILEGTRARTSFARDFFLDRSLPERVRQPDQPAVVVLE